MTPIAHIRASVRKTKLGYAATIHVTETATRQQYSRRIAIHRVTPKDAILDGMKEAQELAEFNGYKFRPIYANAGDVYAQENCEKQPKYAIDLRLETEYIRR